MKKIISDHLVMIVGLLLATVGHAEPSAVKTRIVVSSGVLNKTDSFNAFKHSRVFRSDEIAPFRLTALTAFETDHAIFIPDEAVEPQHFFETAVSGERMVAAGLISDSYRGILVKGNANDALRRYLDAGSARMHMEKRTFKNGGVLAVSKLEGRDVVWPKRADELRVIPAVTLIDEHNATHYAIVSRRVGSLPHRIGLIDRLLADKSLPTSWVDVGSTEDALDLSEQRIKIVQTRSLATIFAGLAELLALRGTKDALKALPAVYPYDGHAHRSSTHNKVTVNWWAASGKEVAWPLFDSLGKHQNIDDAIAAMRKQNLDPDSALNIVYAYSEESAARLANSVYVDLVLLVAHLPYQQMETKASISLKKADSDVYAQVAPIIKISNLDITEIILSGPHPYKVENVELVRHPMSDALARAQDVPFDDMPVEHTQMLALGDKMLVKEDFENILGGIMLENTKADVAIFTELQQSPAIQNISRDVAKSILSHRGTIQTITISGKQLKRIAKLNASKSLPHTHVIYGLNGKTGSMGGRMIGDNERYDVAVSEEALLDLFGMNRIGGFTEFSTDRAMFISAVYADPKQLFFVSGQKAIPISDTSDEIERAVRSLKSGQRFDEVVEMGLANLSVAQMERFIASSEGLPRHVITFDIAYLDLGISKNFVNSEYERASSGFPTSRGNIPPFAHLFIYTKMSLNHQMPGLHTSLFNETKYMHTNLDAKPEKDKTRLGVRMRLPWENSYFQESDVVISPILTSTFETKIAPHPWSKDPTVYKKPRVRRIDTLLGFNFDFTKLGFDTDLGAAMAADFNRTRAYHALDFGPGLNFLGKWRLIGPLELNTDISAVYLFGLPGSTKKDKIALGAEGVVWLRFARFYDFSVAATSDFLIATLQEKSDRVILSSIFGLTVSYGRLFRLLG